MPRDAYSEKESSLGLGSATLFKTNAILTSTMGLAVILALTRLWLHHLPPNERFVVCLDVGEKRS
jgi:hypothetical protein